MLDDIGPLTFLERVARLEERLAAILPLLDEIRAEQKVIGNTIARASGGFRMLIMLGGVVGAAGALRKLLGWAIAALGIDGRSA